MTNQTETPQKSIGHIEFIGRFEFYAQAGQIIRASIDNCMDINGRRHGRWECPEHMAESFLSRYREFES